VRKSPLTRFLISASLALLVTPAAIAKTVQVGTCLPDLQTYPTISQAVTSVGVGSTIMVCPGNYPEQVTITQPLTLRGVQSGNAANPTIVVPPGGLTQSVVSLSNGVTMFFQIVVLGTEAGLVNIRDLAIDGNNNNVTQGALLGVYYQNSSGTIRNMATYNQVAGRSGFGIWMESTTSPTKTITVTNNSVHDFDSGAIRCNCNASMTVDIDSNSVVSTNLPSSQPPGEAIDISSPGKISNNIVIANLEPPAVASGAGIVTESNALISGNTLVGWSIFALADSNTITSNRVLLSSAGINIAGTNNHVEHNFLMNLPGGAGISFNCSGTGNTVIHNRINDAAWGIIDLHGTNTISPNTFTNVANVISPPC
jgi:hypothetical protein